MGPVSERLDTVTIEKKPFEELIPLYDHAESFFFCDPPYMHGYDYGLEFDHGKLREVLSSTKGRWLLTLDDCNEARQLFDGFHAIPVTRQKGIDRRHGEMTYDELIILNY